MAQSQQHTVVSVDRVIAAPRPRSSPWWPTPRATPRSTARVSWCRLKEGASQHLTLGSTFGMSMKMGVPYTVTNTVIEFEQDRRIAWQTVLAGPLGRFLGGRIWRYELEPVDGGTKVAESWDLSQDKQAFFLKNPKIGQHTAASMSKSLDRLAEITES